MHVAVWARARNTGDLTRFIAVEARSYVVSVLGLDAPGVTSGQHPAGAIP